MDIQLLNGSYTAQEAEYLLRQLVAVKTSFHMQRIDTATDNEEDIKHSEQRMKELETGLRNALSGIRRHPHARISMYASVRLEAEEVAVV